MYITHGTIHFEGHASKATVTRSGSIVTIDFSMNGHNYKATLTDSSNPSHPYEGMVGGFQCVRMTNGSTFESGFNDIHCRMYEDDSMVIVGEWMETGRCYVWFFESYLPIGVVGYKQPTHEVH